jgi:hypothetical protein
MNKKTIVAGRVLRAAGSFRPCRSVRSTARFSSVAFSSRSPAIGFRFLAFCFQLLVLGFLPFSAPAAAPTAWVDAANRCYFIDAAALGAGPYVFALPGGETVTNATPVLRRRLPAAARPFSVSVNGAAVTVTPHERTLQPPIADGELLVGQCVYGDCPRFRDEIITNRLCNLLVAWNQGEFYTNLPPAVLSAARKDGLYFMSIYSWDNRALNSKLRDQFEGRWLGNNIGEFASYLYQRLPEAEASKIPQHGNLDEVRNRFIDDFIRPQVMARHADYDILFSTSGSSLATYEMQGGMDFMCCELYAVGARNIAYATSEMRGAARKWGTEFWGGWLAEEWQTFPVPYSSRQKYDLLAASLYQQYLMGTSVIVNESGAQSTQAQDYTAEANKAKQDYDGHAPREYRRTVKEFYDWTRAHPRAKGTPATPIAFVLGNNDNYVGMSSPIFAIWGQHKTAATNANWRYTLPEETWQTVQDAFFPTPGDALAPYPNDWVGGTPFGPCDVINIDSEARPEDLSRYAFIAYAGWNTMTPPILRVLARYVRDGGNLFICLPHFSTRVDREHAKYTAADLVNGGDFRPLIDLRVTGREGDNARAEVLPPDTDCGPCESKAPNVYEQRRGKGRVRLLSAWPYPGHGTPLAKVYADELKACAAAVQGPVRLSGPDAQYISYAVYGDTIYLLNTDCVHPRSVTLRTGENERPLSFTPIEMKTLVIPRP